MTKEELRDQLVKLAGLSRNESDPIRVYWRGVDRFDLNTLDGIAALWPEWWWFAILESGDVSGWKAQAWRRDKLTDDKYHAVGEGDTEIEARMALTIKVLEAGAK